MDSLEFILILAVLAVVLDWYLKNERAQSCGLSGLLALKPDPAAAAEKKRKSYRLKQRARDAKAGLRDSRLDAAPKTYRTEEEGGGRRRRYRTQDEARYRVQEAARAGRDAD